MIPFNKPYLTGKETTYITEAVYSGKISGNGFFTKKCHDFFHQRYGFKNCLLTNSCTDALEMTALLLDIEAGDEIIMPSYTFVSTANAFMLRGAKIVFADSQADHPNVDADKLESLITDKTKAIVVVHYAGMACDMDKIMGLAEKYDLAVIEDAAQAIHSTYKGKPLGGIGSMSTFSFHETKNIISGEGGMLVINDEKYKKRAEIIWEKGTNRAAFFRGEVAKYNWVDLGSSFLPSEVTAAFLYAQLENLEQIQQKRQNVWHTYHEHLSKLESLGVIKLPQIPKHSGNNAHIFYILCKDIEERTALINYLKEKNILAVFHYLPLHKSPFFEEKWGKQNPLPQSVYFEETLLRLPLFFDLSESNQAYIIEQIMNFYAKRIVDLKPANTPKMQGVSEK
ncbi:MAG: dTDP-4-amino-4,6-dideoxygalactose transaminase [Bacteroidota bacterium]